MRLFLLPELQHLRDPAVELGVSAHVLPDNPHPANRVDAPNGPTSGLVLFTSGSTGKPKPVFKPLSSACAHVLARARAFALPERGRIVGTLPLDRAYGFYSSLLMASLLHGHLELVDSTDYPTLRELFASPGDYSYWACTPSMADMVLRSARGGPRREAPRICGVVGRMSSALAEGFRDYFGVPLRGQYGSTETGMVAVDAGEPRDVRYDRVGHPLPGVDIQIDGEPGKPLGPEGRIWIKSPWLPHAYAFSGGGSALWAADEWWPSPDRGYLDGDGALVLTGRVDEMLRTASGRLVNLAEIAAVLGTYPGVSDALAVGLESPIGPHVGVLAESREAIDPGELRAFLSGFLDHPVRVVAVVPALPRLADGRPDRLKCGEVLEEATRPR